MQHMTASATSINSPPQKHELALADLMMAWNQLPVPAWMVIQTDAERQAADHQDPVIIGSHLILNYHPICLLMAVDLAPYLE